MGQKTGSNGIVYWNNKDDGFSGFSTSENVQNALFGSVNPNKNVASGFQSPEAVSKRIRLSTEFSEQEVEVNCSEESSPLGLTLRKTPSLLNLVEMKLSQGSNTNYSNNLNPKMDDFVSQTVSEKLKASSLPASALKIGSWERISRHEGDLTVKCYYAKRKLVWEVLEWALKSKIEIQWSDILAIRAIIGDGEPGILAIELDEPPLFFRETNPQPRKHTLWQQTSDFTGGQAPFYRRHYIKFPPGVLDKHYEKLLQCDQQFPPWLHYPSPSIPTPSFVPPHHVQYFKPTTGPPLCIMDSNSPLSVTDFSRRDEKIYEYAFENQEKAVWNQGVNNTVNTFGRGDQIQGLPFTASITQANAAIPCQAYRVLSYGEEAKRPNPNNALVSDIENHLLGDSQVVCSDDKNILAKVSTMCSLLEPLEEANSRNIGGDHSILSTTEHPRVDDEVLYPQPIHGFPPQVSNENLMMNLPSDNSSYPFVFSDAMVEDLATVDAAREACHWK
ncbi:hypothetical protein F0562_020029 [Nyssa sinensis]|uniref:TRF2/HOY1 PH-like domain-containing protein n=1 Tax=Nyssa sinensis TaxID=561372 RepID=A0A5J5BQI5_9ASTE|nr:hypothetical protein F0562_020029 [Nyssa sinensis]